ncbi:uncharacterized protein EI90DRAFT_173430 [Cantharellus anzutake]|uniref:uncharacterized protein n=1 Tax=Cantharellus anzutake TaxID=1750568 RepID=UPI001908C04C|nr:uncharacterized protein EI90DRAFT_173430 [Cantharellus anzutake]KAF8336409.1 hypothetical protein EI90DRAFT_173430 [Cantharellus anzutake]
MRDGIRVHQTARMRQNLQETQTKDELWSISYGVGSGSLVVGLLRAPLGSTDFGDKCRDLHLVYMAVWQIVLPKSNVRTCVGLLLFITLRKKPLRSQMG